MPDSTMKSINLLIYPSLVCHNVLSRENYYPKEG